MSQEFFGFTWRGAVSPVSVGDVVSRLSVQQWKVVMVCGNWCFICEKSLLVVVYVCGIS